MSHLDDIAASDRCRCIGHDHESKTPSPLSGEIWASTKGINCACRGNYRNDRCVVFPLSVLIATLATKSAWQLHLA